MCTITPIVTGDTLNNYAHEYLRGRVARGEITRPTATALGYNIDGLVASFGRRPLSQFGPKAIDRWLESIGHHAPSTRRLYLSRIRGFCRWMVAQGHLSVDPTSHVDKIRQPRHVPQTLTDREVSQLLAYCPNQRARAVVWLMIGLGCRCCEVSRLNVEDYDPDSATIRLVGKGGHERRLPVPIEVAAVIDRHLDEMGRVAGPMIRSFDDGHRLSARTLSQYMGRWMTESGVKLRARDGRSAHGLRRTAGSDVMDLTGDIRIVQEMLGHEHVETTARHYLRPVSIHALREAMEGRDYAAIA